MGDGERRVAPTGAAPPALHDPRIATTEPTDTAMLPFSLLASIVQERLGALARAAALLRRARG